ncbi:hypothetical protein A374_17974 [Fictibacillus macauensis ZFHKF-1]|uniref:DUF1284 domain-containing protein n=1 Tax=Fictibacillus macauensis ZFHKF-1 TaxID=1196324 RepID=I8UAZ1_9BACL|nr:DUF1284 domain-containing protein [Fictibacillus macauensis]EIT83948.1 hypothetical protein A374_17974 [Fictibacillus macauensis ZFHKF-1]
MILLRGHHLFCLLGFRGMGYSKEYVDNMKQLHKTLRENPDSAVKIILGPDELCAHYPNSGEYHCQAEEIYERDAAILQKLQLNVGQQTTWREIETAIKNYSKPDDIATICETCSWRTYGVCEEGIREMHEGKGLRVVK